jgi:lipopolysaccharide transport system permease protein
METVSQSPEYLGHAAGDPAVKIIRPPRVSIQAAIRGLRSLFGFRGLLYALTMLRLHVRYKQSILGWLWAVLQPLCLMLLYTLVFSTVATVRTGGIPYPVFVFSGLLPWVFFSSSITTSTSGLVAHSYLLTRVYFPREIIPLSYVAAAFVDFLIASVILAGLMLYYGIHITRTALLAVPIMLSLMVFATAVALLMSALQARFRDIGVAMPLIIQVWMFATPVVYPLTAIPDRFRPICLANPVAGLIESFRQAVLNGTFSNGRMLAYSALSSCALFICSYIVFKNLDANMADFV